MNEPTVKLAEGVYVLDREIANPNADRRHNVWQYHSSFKPGLFRVASYGKDSAGTPSEYPGIQPCDNQGKTFPPDIYGGTLHNVTWPEAYEALIQALRPATAADLQAWDAPERDRHAATTSL